MSYGWSNKHPCKHCLKGDHDMCRFDASRHLFEQECDCDNKCHLKERYYARAAYLIATDRGVLSYEPIEMRELLHALKGQKEEGFSYWFTGLKAVPEGVLERAGMPRFIFEEGCKGWGKLQASLEFLVEPYTKNKTLSDQLVEYVQTKPEMKEEHVIHICRWISTHAAEFWNKFASGKLDESCRLLAACLSSGPLLKRGFRLFQGRGSDEEPANETLPEGTEVKSVGPWSTSWHPFVCLNFMRDWQNGKRKLLVIDIDHDAIPAIPTQAWGQRPDELEVILPPGLTVKIDKVETRSIWTNFSMRWANNRRDDDERYKGRVLPVELTWLRVIAPPS